jgi:hypothetical protein
VAIYRFNIIAPNKTAINKRLFSSFKKCPMIILKYVR